MDTQLSKSTYLEARQCLKRLWLSRRAPDLATPDHWRATLAATSADIGRRARTLFAGGVVVPAEDHGEARAETRALLADPTVPAIFAAALEHAGVRIRIDVLERRGDGTWTLCEVKAGTRVKDVHVDDVAVQLHVARGAGIPVGAVELVHVNDGYVRGETIDWTRFFVRRDVTEPALARAAGIAAELPAMHAALAAADAPAIAPSPHCFSPYPCGFWRHCTAEQPRDSVLFLPRLTPDALAALRTAGVERIPEIPDDFPLVEPQTRIRAALRSGRPFVAPELGAALAACEPPVDYLDFETMSPAVPLYPGTRPYERLPFQWSLHRLGADGTLTAHAFLADGRGDPRRAFTESLIAALAGSTRPIVVYSRFEADALEELADALEDLAAPLTAIAARLVDLYDVVRRHVYHRDFGFSFSIKRVAPALAPGFGYTDLEDIADGATASWTFAAFAAAHATEATAGGVSGAPADDGARLRHALLAYCERDTLALVALHRALRACARVGGGNDDAGLDG